MTAPRAGAAARLFRRETGARIANSKWGASALSALNAVVTVVVPLGVFVWFARQLAPETMGVLAYAVAWIEVLKAICPYGLYEALLVEREPHRERDAAAGTILILSSLVACAVYAVVVAMMPARLGAGGTAMRIGLYLLGARLLFDTMAIQPTALLARDRAYGRLALRALIANLAGLVAAIATSFMLSPLAGMIAWYLALSFVTWLSVALGGTAWLQLSFRFGHLAPLVRVGWLSTQVRAIGTLNNFLDQVLIASFAPAARLAHYNLGKRVELAEITASNAFVSTLYQPRFAGSEGDTLRRDFREGMVMMTWIFGVPGVVLMVNAASVVATVFGARWLPATTLVQALTLSGFARVVQNVQGAYFSTHGHNRMLRNRSLVSTILGLSTICLIPWIGMAAAAWAIAAKNVGVALWSALPSRHLGSIRFLLGRIVVVLGVAALAAMGAARGMALAVPAAGFGHALALWVVSGLAGYAGAALVAHRDIAAAVAHVRRRGRLPA